MIRLVSKLLVALVLVGFVATASMAQETENIIRPSTKSGSAAMYFDFGGLGSMAMTNVVAQFLFSGSGTGSTIPNAIVYGAGIKTYLADEFALRASLGFSTSTDGDADPAKSSDGKTTGTFFGLNAGVEFHTKALYSLSPYFGGLVSFASGSSTNTKDQVAITSGKNTTLATTTSETKVSATAFGVEALAGFDWYIFRGVAIGGEFGLGFGSGSGSRTSGGTTVDSPSSTEIAIGSGSVHLLFNF